MNLKHAGTVLLWLGLLVVDASCNPKTSTSPVATPASSSVAVASATLTPTVATTPTAAQPTSTATPPITFTQDFNAQPPHWSFLSVDNGQPIVSPVIRDGFLVFDLSSANAWGYALYRGQSYSDVVVDAQVQSRITGDGAAGLVCQYDEHKGWYEFNIFADQTYQLLFGQWLAPGIARYTPLYRAASPAIRNDENEMALECQGNQLAPSINGTALRKWPEQKFSLQRGQIGLSVSSFVDAPYTIAFDWVKVSQP